MNALYTTQRAEMNYRISRISDDVLSARRSRRAQRRAAKNVRQEPMRHLTRADLTRSA